MLSSTRKTSRVRRAPNAANGTYFNLMATLKEHGLSGKLGETFTIPTLGRLKAKTLMLVSLGPKGEADADAVRKAAIKAARSASKVGTVATSVAQVGDSPEESTHAFVEGLILGAYRFDRYKEKPIDDSSKQKPRLKKVVLLTNREYTSMYNASLVMSEQMKAVGINAELLIFDWPAALAKSQQETTGTKVLERR